MNGQRHNLGIAASAIFLSTILIPSLARRWENKVPQRLLVAGASLAGGALSAFSTYVTISVATGSTPSTVFETSVGIIGAALTGAVSSKKVNQTLG
jgi:hypothetical protein